jgi:ParB-like chromosome segregation protein Spo0J
MSGMPTMEPRPKETRPPETYRVYAVDMFAASVVRKVLKALKPVADLDGDNLIGALNEIRKALHEMSPFKAEPVDCVLWIKCEDVTANDYNPNTVAPPEMKLLEHSIGEDGYTQPVVTWMEGASREVIDGFHRNRVGRESKRVRERTGGYLPVVTVNDARTDRGDRIASTIRHNRARGKHRVDSMSEIVVELKRRNWSDEKIGKDLGMDPDEVLRLAQISGLAEMFADREFSQAWEAEDSLAIDEADRLDVQEEAAGSSPLPAVGER